MIAEIISTGNEILRGNSVDTNSAWISRELQALGLPVRYHTTVGDDLEVLTETIGAACRRANVVILTGGLGPTDDDLTRDAAAQAFGVPLVFRSAAYRKIRNRFRKLRVSMAKINRRQAYFPAGARELKNGVGTAAGFGMEGKGTLFFALPGVPREMKPMFRDDVLPRLPRRRGLRVLEIRTFGLPEGDVDEIVAPLVAKAKGTTYGLTVSGGTVNIVLRTEGPRRGGGLRALRDRLKKRLGRAYLGEGRVTLQEIVASHLKRRRATIAVAESCTGGLLASLLAGVPGISEVLLEGVVTYSNASKAKRLGVPERLLRKHGAVSGPVARAMAEGVARTSGAKMGVSTTGIAGPAGGTRKKPVGLVYFAVAYRGRTEVRHRIFPGDRTQVRQRSANAALNLVRLVLT